MLRVNLLGQFVVGDTATGTLLAPPKARVLLAYILLENGRWVGRHTLAEMLWPESDEKRSSASLRTALHRLQMALAEVGDGRTIETSRDSLRALPGVCGHVDAHRFRALARHGLESGSVDALIEAAALYRGDLLEGMETLVPSIDAWWMSDRCTLSDARLSVLRTVTRELSASGQLYAALHHALEWRNADLYCDDAWEAVVALYGRTGQRAAAAREYERAASLYAGDLGIDPPVALQQAARNHIDVPRMPAGPHGVLPPVPASSDLARNAAATLAVGREQIERGDCERGAALLEQALTEYQRLGDRARLVQATISAAEGMLECQPGRCRLSDALNRHRGRQYRRAQVERRTRRVTRGLSERAAPLLWA